MFVAHGRRAFAMVVALLAGLAVLAGAAPARAHQGVPAQPTITFPDGPETSTYGTVKVKFDAGGDRRVTAFRYSLNGPSLNRTVEAVPRGGSATVSIEVGSIAGERQVFAAAVDRHGRSGSWVSATFTARQTVQFSGSVVSGITWLPVAGAVVTLEPGGWQATTDTNGLFSFSGVPDGLYTGSAAVSGPCPAASFSQEFLINEQGTMFEFYLFPLDDEPCSTE